MLYSQYLNFGKKILKIEIITILVQLLLCLCGMFFFSIRLELYLKILLSVILGGLMQFMPTMIFIVSIGKNNKTGSHMLLNTLISILIKYFLLICIAAIIFIYAFHVHTL